MDDQSNYCQNLLRGLDYERYLASLYIPQPFRDMVVALDSFDAEISRVPLIVSEPIPGEIRLQWWRDVLAGERKGEAAQNPLAAQLLGVIEQFDLPVALLDRYLDARIFDLYHDPMPDMATFEGYCGETASVFFQLKLHALDRNTSAEFANLCGYSGMVRGIVTVLRHLAHHRRSQRVYVPGDLISAAGLTPQQWLTGNDPDKSRTVLTHMRELAGDYLSRVNVELSKADREVFPFFLPLATSQAYLDEATRLDVAVLDQPPVVSPLRKYWKLWWAMRKHRL